MEESEKIVALASSVSIIAAKEFDAHELAALSEFLGLLRHNLDVIRHRRAATRASKVKEKKA